MPEITCRKIKTFLLSLLFLLVVSPLYSQEKAVYLIPVKGVIDLGLSGFVRRATEEAAFEKARAIIFEIDTPGGRVDALLDIHRYISAARPIPSHAYIGGDAWSAGALIALSCQDIYMAPGSSIGSAEPRLGIGAGPESNDEKTVSAIRAKFKSVAEENRHSSLLAEAMVDKDIELVEAVVEGKPQVFTREELEILKKRPGAKKVSLERTIIGRGKILNLSAEEAERLGLAKKIFSSRAELLEFLGLAKETLVERAPNWAENLARFLTHPIVASLLLSLGFVGLIFELKMPGWGISGTVGLVCLGLFFWGHHLVRLAEWLEVALFIVGAVLLLIEIFALPGFGIAGISGITLILLSLFLAMTRFPFQYPSFEAGRALSIIASSLVVTLAFLFLGVKYLPGTGLWSRLAVLTQQDKTYSSLPAHREKFLEQTGITQTPLRPSGKALLAEGLVDVVTEAEFIEKGRKVKVIKIEGAKVVVEEVV